MPFRLFVFLSVLATVGCSGPTIVADSNPEAAKAQAFTGPPPHAPSPNYQSGPLSDDFYLSTDGLGPEVVNAQRLYTAAGEKLVVALTLDDPRLAWENWLDQAGTLDREYERIQQLLDRCEQIDRTICWESEQYSETDCPAELAFQKCQIEAYPSPQLYWSRECGARRLTLGLYRMNEDSPQPVLSQVLSQYACQTLVEPVGFGVGDLDKDGSVEVWYSFTTYEDAYETSVYTTTFEVRDLEGLQLELQLSDKTSNTGYDTLRTTSSLTHVDLDHDPYPDLRMFVLTERGYCPDNTWYVNGEPAACAVCGDEYSAPDDSCRLEEAHLNWRYDPAKDQWVPVK